MKNNYVMATLLCFFAMSLFAQEIIEDFEYNSGDPFAEWWYNCPTDCPVVDVNAPTGTKSAFVGGSSSNGITLDFMGDGIDQNLTIDFLMYIPSGKEAYFYLDEEITIPGGSDIVIGHFYFNQDGLSPGTGIVQDNYSASGNQITFSYPEDQWFRILIDAFIDGVNPNTWGMDVNNATVVPYNTPLSDIDNNEVDDISGMTFFPIGANTEYFIDTINVLVDTILDVEASELSEFLLFPNPSDGVLKITSEEIIVASRIYSMQGAIVNQSLSEAQIDVSKLATGIYFVEVETVNGSSVQKLLKE